MEKQTNPSQPNPSTVSFQSTTTVSSTSPLSSRPRHPPKDYAAALSTLQSRYGTGGFLPSPKEEPSKKLPESPQASPSTSQAPSRNASGQSIPADSQITLASSSLNSEPGSASSGTSSNAAEGSRKKSKSKAGSILKSLFKGLFFLVNMV